MLSTSPSAILTEDGREIARSKQADEAVWELLGLSPGSGRTLDDGALASFGRTRRLV